MGISLIITIVLVILGVIWLVSGINKYNNYTLLQFTPYKDRQLRVLKELVDSEEMNILKYSHGLNDTTDIVVSPSKLKNMRRLAKILGMKVQYTHHYGRYFDKEAVMLRTKSDEYDMFKYNSYHAISSHLQTLLQKYSNIVKLETLCVSYEGREMKLFKISADHKAKNPIIFIDAGAHAREWAAPALAMYIVDQLVDAANRMPHTAAELLGVDWYILPVVNPDGYEFTRKDPSNRLWRKSRSKTWRKECVGVDINRNFGYQWGYIGASFDPCSFQTYAGRRPFSERETRIVRRLLWEYSKRIKLYMSIHSYGQYLVYPWGYTGDELPPNWKKLHRVAQMFSEAVVDAGGQPFKVMSAGQWYPAAGASDDFAFAQVKIPYCYTLEITDGHEFIFPESLLSTALPQFYEGFKVIAKEIRKEFVDSKN